MPGFTCQSQSGAWSIEKITPAALVMSSMFQLKLSKLILELENRLTELETNASTNTTWSWREASIYLNDGRSAIGEMEMLMMVGF